MSPPTARSAEERLPGPVPWGAVVAYLIAAGLLGAGRVWVAGVIERALESQGALPGLFILAIETLSGPGWFYTVGAVAALLAVRITRRRRVPWLAVGGGLLAYAMVVWGVADAVGRTAHLSSTEAAVAWSALIWAPVFAIALIAGGGRLVRR